ncbi:MAG: hypothetical protein Q9209_006829 [Squamulea sp. 1 TL-2023]
MGNNTSKPTRPPIDTTPYTHISQTRADDLMPSATVSEEHPTSDDNDNNNNDKGATSKGINTADKPPVDLQLARYTRSGRIGSIKGPSNGEPQVWMLEEALVHYNPYMGSGSGLFCVPHLKNTVANETIRVILAVSEGERPSMASELQEATVVRRSWSKRYDYFSLDKDGWRYIVSFDSFDDTGSCWWRWGSYQKGLDRPLAFSLEVGFSDFPAHRGAQVLQPVPPAISSTSDGTRQVSKAPKPQEQHMRDADVDKNSVACSAQKAMSGVADRLPTIRRSTTRAHSWGATTSPSARPHKRPRTESAAAEKNWRSTDDGEDSASASPNRRIKISTRESGGASDLMESRIAAADEETEDLYLNTSDHSSSNHADQEPPTNMTPVAPAQNCRKEERPGPGDEVQNRRRIRSSAREIEIDEIKAQKYQKRADARKYDEKARAQERLVTEQETSIERKEEEASKLREEESRIVRKLENVQTKAETIEAEITRQKADVRRQREEISSNRVLAQKAQEEYEKTEEQLAAVKAAERNR